jgi:aromatic ring-cleaving dioxygenase
MSPVSTITGFHAHVYFDPDTRAAAERVREGLSERFSVELGRWHEQPIGPHSKAMYQVAFANEELASVLPWLMLHRSGLSILVHPMTGDDVADHGAHALWLGTSLPIDFEFLRKHAGA